MSSRARTANLHLIPEDHSDEILVSKRKFGELQKGVEPLREQLPRKEDEELRRQLALHVNPNVPPSARNHAPGLKPVRPRVPSGERKRPGAKFGHEGATREPLVPDEKVAPTAHLCGTCQGSRLKLKGTETQQEVEVIREGKVTDYTQAVHDCIDCGAEVRATLPDGRGPSGHGPQLQAEVVLGKIDERPPYRKIEGRLEREGTLSCPVTVEAVVRGASERLQGTADGILRRMRGAVVMRKIIGTLRNEKGANALARSLSAFGTWR